MIIGIYSYIVNFIIGIIIRGILLLLEYIIILLILLLEFLLLEYYHYWHIIIIGIYQQFPKLNNI